MGFPLPPALVTEIAAEIGRDPTTVRRAVAAIERDETKGTASTTRAAVERSLVRRGLMPRRVHAPAPVSDPARYGGSPEGDRGHHAAPSAEEREGSR